MHYLLKASGIATAIAFASFTPGAFALEVTSTYTCQDVGTGAPEPLGDREGHTVTVAQCSCRVDSLSAARGQANRCSPWLKAVTYQKLLKANWQLSCLDCDASQLNH